MVEGVVDTMRYPLADPGSGAWRELVERVRHELASTGCCVLDGFVPAARQEALRQESAAVAPLAHDEIEVVNAYNLPLDTPLPAGHPGRIPLVRGNAFVARDRIPSTAVVQRLYTSPFVQRFVAACAGVPVVYPLADPLSGLCLNVIRPGLAHPWHFDTNELTVSVLVQDAIDGGVFEYCPDIRSPGNENLADVRGVLEGRRDDLVRRLRLRPGDLQLFRGRYSLHRVSTVRGDVARHSAIFAYSERPGIVGSVARTRQLFGRVLPEHLAAGHAVRRDRLLD